MEGCSETRGAEWSSGKGKIPELAWPLLEVEGRKQKDQKVV